MASFDSTVVDEKLDIRMPHLPMTISFGNRSVDISGVLDTGAEISILPYSIGCKLGAKWEEQPKSFPVTQGFGGYKTRLVKTRATHPQLTNDNIPVQLLFAWAKSDSIPLLFGQIDLFMEFNVCFYRTQNFFEVWRR